MELEFDKEIDAILRKGRSSGNVPPGDTAKPHLDADEIAAFAENALPERLRQPYMAHFAECEGCRKTLSSVILLNSEAGTDAASAVAAPVVTAGAIPWYRKLFLFPNLAYVLGGLVVVFSGFLAVSVLRNAGGQNSEVSQVKSGEVPMATPAVGLGGSSFDSNVSNSNAASIGNSMNSASNTMASSNSSSMSNAAAAKTPAFAANVPSGAGSSKPAGQPFTVDGIATKDERSIAASSPPPPPVERPSTADTSSTLGEETDRKKRESEAAKEKNEVTTRQLSNLPYSARGAAKTMKSRAQNDSVDLKPRDAEPAPKQAPQSLMVAPRKVVGGKFFELKQGVWYDSVYQGQRTSNVRRGSDDFKKLDSGLRSIANGLSGAAVIVWNDKAYRIQ